MPVFIFLNLWSLWAWTIVPACQRLRDLQRHGIINTETKTMLGNTRHQSLSLGGLNIYCDWTQGLNSRWAKGPHIFHSHSWALLPASQQVCYGVTQMRLGKEQEWTNQPTNSHLLCPCWGTVRSSCMCWDDWRKVWVSSCPKNPVGWVGS